MEIEKRLDEIENKLKELTKDVEVHHEIMVVMDINITKITNILGGISKILNL